MKTLKLPLIMLVFVLGVRANAQTTSIKFATDYPKTGGSKQSITVKGSITLAKDWKIKGEGVTVYFILEIDEKKTEGAAKSSQAIPLMGNDIPENTVTTLNPPLNSGQYYWVTMEVLLTTPGNKDVLYSTVPKRVKAGS